MATYYKRKGTRGVRWTARVRLSGREVTKTFGSKAAAETWVRAQEGAIELGEFRRPATRGIVLADLIDNLTKHRIMVRRPLGKTATNSLRRIKDQHGLEPIDALTVPFWRKHALDRVKGGVESQTAAQDLLYAAAVVRHAARDGIAVAKDAPAQARLQLKDEGLRVTSRMRERRISDAELVSLLDWIDKHADRTHIPLGDIVRFALATAMRRGEILAIRHEDLQDRVILVRNRKHPRDHERVDEVPLLPAHPKWPRDDPLDIIRRQPTKSGRIFPYVLDSVGFWFEKAVKGTGASDIVFHLLRHEALSRYAERGLDPLRLQLIGGHRDLRHLQRYVKLSAAGLAAEVAP
jgi:integrase